MLGTGRGSIATVGRSRRERQLGAGQGGRTMPTQEPLDDLRATLKVGQRLARDPDAFMAAHQAFIDVDAARFQSILDRAGVGDDCDRICFLFCEKLCIALCATLCPEPPPQVDADEVLQFTTAMAALNKRSLERLVAAAEKGDRAAFAKEVASHDLTRFCHQVCHFVCRVRCRRVCRELCNRPAITRVSSIPTPQFDAQGFGSGPSIPPFQVAPPDPAAGRGDHPVGRSSWLMGVFNLAGVTQYKVEWATSPGGPYSPIAVTVDGYDQIWPFYIPCTRSPSGGGDPGWYDVADLCLSDGGATPTTGEKTLLYWPTPPDGLYYLRLRVRNGSTELVSTPRAVRVDNTAPATPVITLELVTDDGTTKPLKCGQVKKGDGLIRVTVQASDPNFSRLSVAAHGNSSLSVPVVAVPEGTAGPAVPLSKTYNGNVADSGYPVPTSFIWDPWSDPKIVPCCYVVRIDIWDRAVLNNSWSGGHHNAGWEAIEIGF